MKQVVALLFILTSFALAQNANDTNISFKSWKAKHNKDYTLKGNGYSNNVNETQAEKNFNANAARVKKHNSDKNAAYKQSLNENADMTDNEVTQRRTGLIHDTSDRNLKSSGNSASSFSIAVANVTEAELKASPASLDYTSQMTPIKNQLTCGSCWAFSTVAVIEWYLKKNGSNAILSEQSLVDCCRNNLGCNGGVISRSYDCLKSTGVPTQLNYPYKGVTQKCQVKKNIAPIFKVPSYSSILISGREDLLMSYLNKYGPLSVVINAGGTGFMLYSSGVFYDPKCSSNIRNADHAVVVAGFGTNSKGQDYWIIRNSWGTSWGINGYMWLARNRSNHCGVANSISFATYG